MMQAEIFSGHIFSHESNRCELRNIQEDYLLSEISSTLQKLENVKNRFNYETESELIDALIFEERSLRARYSHLISQARSNKIMCSPTTHMSFSAKNQEKP